MPEDIKIEITEQDQIAVMIAKILMEHYEMRGANPPDKPQLLRMGQLWAKHLAPSKIPLKYLFMAFNTAIRLRTNRGNLDPADVGTAWAELKQSNRFD